MAVTKHGHWFIRCSLGVWLLVACGGDDGPGGLVTSSSSAGRSGTATSMLGNAQWNGSGGAKAAGSNANSGGHAGTTTKPSDAGGATPSSTNASAGSGAGAGGAGSATASGSSGGAGTSAGTGSAAGAGGAGNTDGGRAGNAAGGGSSAATGDGRYDGEWSGMTSQGKLLTFTILMNKLVQLRFTVKVKGDICEVSDVTTNFMLMQAITNDAFTLDNKDPMWTRKIGAHFRDASNAEGDFSADLKTMNPGAPSCHATGSGTWSATKL